VFHSCVPPALPLHQPGVPIGRAAALLGTTPKAIRTYHARGLVPEPERDPSGYRRYDSATLVRLARVRRLRGLGLSLDAIGPLLRGGDGGRALRDELRRLDGVLAEEERRLAGRRALIAGLLAEGVDDPIAVAAEDSWEERAIGWLRRVLPDLTPEEELSERRFQRALSALLPLDGPPPPEMPDLEPGSPLLRRVGAAHRALHALADAPGDDPRVDALVPELASTLIEVAAMLTPGPTAAQDGRPAGTAPPDEEAVHSAMSAALSTLPPAQRRVMEGVLEALLNSDVARGWA